MRFCMASIWRRSWSRCGCSCSFSTSCSAFRSALPWKISPYGSKSCVFFGAFSSRSILCFVFSRYFMLAALRRICRCFEGLW
uniref:Putative secreted peptide n=1 Tax=Anopheles braziliensis TaxID=58242 RepID=A0A2M3ZR38_9DIPT